jgi:cytochrome P450
VTRFDYDPLVPEVLANPYPFYAELRQQAPVYHVPAHGFWVVSRYPDVLGVLRQPQLFSSAAMAAAVVRPSQFTPDDPDAADEHTDPDEQVSIVGADGARHTRLRDVVNRGFTPGRIAALAPRVREIARELAEPLLEAREFDLVGDFAVPLPVRVIAEMLGVDPERRDDFKRWADAAMAGVFDPIDAVEADTVGSALVEMFEYIEGVIEARRQSPGPDLISVLVRAEDERGVLTPVEVRNFVFTLLVAGSVTTTHLISNLLVALLDHPEQLARVAAERALVPGAVEEALRYLCPVQMLWRTATADIELAGTKIPEGSTVAPLFASANRDETVFPEADRFDVERNPKEHLAFGNGVHFCLGAALARLEARVALEALLAGGRLPESAEQQLSWPSSLVFRGPRRLRLSFAG